MIHVLLLAYSGAIAILLFAGFGSIAIFALGAQFLLACFIALRLEGLHSWAARIQALDAILLRTLFLSYFLFTLSKRIGMRGRFNSIPQNLVILVMALALGITGFLFGRVVSTGNFVDALHIGIAATGVLAGFFILSQHTSALRQLLGFLTLEAGILLLEALTGYHERWQIQLGLALVFLWSLLLAGNLVQEISTAGIAQEKSTSLVENDIL